MPKRRIFISIDVPDELKNIAENYLESFLFKKENWHITIVFCGYLNEEELARLKESAKNIALEIQSFELTPDKIIFAPPQRTPRMVWLTFKPSPEFLNLSKNFSEFSQEKREQSPHLTLARFKEEHYSNLKKFLPQDGVDLKNETKPFRIESINIMESHLSSLGPKYNLLCRNYLK